MADDFEDFNFDDDDYSSYDDDAGDNVTNDDAVNGNDIDQIPDDGDEAEGASRNNSPFYKAAGLLLFIFFLSLLCGGTYYVMRGGDSSSSSDGDGDGNSEVSAEVAAIETRNALVEVTNAAVTQTIIAMEIEAATTPTPAVTPTNTPEMEPSKTSFPTSTPLFETATPSSDDSDSGDGGDSGDNGDSDSNTVLYTPTPIPGLSGDGSGSTGGALPETGIGAWTAALVALGLIGLFMGARKMRYIDMVQK